MKSPPPGLAGGPSLWRGEEVLERDVQEGASRLGQDLGLVDELRVDVDPAPSRAGHPRRERELAVDRNGPSVAHEDARGDRGEAVPRGEQAARFVERGPDEPAVDDPRPRLVAAVKVTVAS